MVFWMFTTGYFWKNCGWWLVLIHQTRFAFQAFKSWSLQERTWGVPGGPSFAAHRSTHSCEKHATRNFLVNGYRFSYPFWFPAWTYNYLWSMFFETSISKRNGLWIPESSKIGHVQGESHICKSTYIHIYIYIQIFHEASESPLPEINIKRLPIGILTSAAHQTNRWGRRIEAHWSDLSPNCGVLPYIYIYTQLGELSQMIVIG